MKFKVAIGVFISVVFIYLTFRQVEFEQMFLILKTAKYLWLLPAFAVMFVSHWFRAMRWRYLVEPIKQISVPPLFSALMIGYAANNVFPLRLGEFMRAYAIAKSQNISKSSAFATVIVERFILDLLALLILLGVTILFYPFRLPYHDEIKLGGYIILAGTLAFIILIYFLITNTDKTLSFLRRIFPEGAYARIEPTFLSFMSGCMVFKRSKHYFTISFLTILIWMLYICSIYIMFNVFGFSDKYGLNLWSSIVILVVVTFSIMLPSSPGALGTYHFLCTEVMKYFHVGNDEAVGFAIVSHAMNILPFTIMGLIYFWRENLRISDISSEEEFIEEDLTPSAGNEPLNP